jgi:anti-sigma regulatory factor (Ser/Thr protein kinase)
VSNAAVERARRTRARSIELRERSEALSQQLVDKLRRSPGPAFGDVGDTFALRLARLRPTVALLRHSLGRWLEQRGVPAEHVRDLTLAASEASANAVEHPVAGHGAFEVEATHRADEVVIVVRDSGGWRPESSSEARGRGLRMIRSLMSEVDVVRSEHGTEIVMRRRLD